SDGHHHGARPCRARRVVRTSGWGVRDQRHPLTGRAVDQIDHTMKTTPITAMRVWEMCGAPNATGSGKCTGRRDSCTSSQINPENAPNARSRPNAIGTGVTVAMFASYPRRRRAETAEPGSASHGVHVLVEERLDQ